MTLIISHATTYCRKPHSVIQEFLDVVQLDLSENKCSLDLLCPGLQWDFYNTSNTAVLCFLCYIPTCSSPDSMLCSYLWAALQCSILWQQQTSQAIIERCISQVWMTRSNLHVRNQFFHIKIFFWSERIPFHTCNYVWIHCDSFIQFDQYF